MVKKLGTSTKTIEKMQCNYKYEFRQNFLPFNFRSVKGLVALVIFLVGSPFILLCIAPSTWLPKVYLMWNGFKQSFNLTVAIWLILYLNQKTRLTFSCGVVHLDKKKLSPTSFHYDCNSYAQDQCTEYPHIERYFELFKNCGLFVKF